MTISRRGFLGIFGATVPVAKFLAERHENILPSMPVVKRKPRETSAPVIEYQTIVSSMCYARVHRDPLTGKAHLMNNMGFRFLWATENRVRLYYNGKWTGRTTGQHPIVQVQCTDPNQLAMISNMEDPYCVEIQTCSIAIGAPEIGGFDIMVRLPEVVEA